MSNIRGLSDVNKNPPARGGPPQGQPQGQPQPGAPGGAGFLGNFLGSMFGAPPTTGAPSGGHGRVKELQQDSEFARELKDAGGKLVVIDFTATWCGPCKMIAPIYAQLSEQYPNVVFLKVDVDKLQAIARQAGITAMPTFQFYHKGAKIDELQGADPNRLQQLIKKYAEQFAGSSATVGGGGQRLGGGEGQRLGGGTGQRLGGGEGPRPEAVKPAASEGGQRLGGGSGDQPAAPRPSNSNSNSNSGFTPDQIMVQGLLDMGFPEQRAIKALKQVNNSSVQAAMDWIFEHMDDADIDTPVDSGSNPTTTVSAQSNTTDAAMSDAGTPTVHNAMCDTCKQQIIGIRYKCNTCPDFDQCHTCRTTTPHNPEHVFAEHEKDIVNPTLTAEERAIQMERLQQKIQEVRKLKQQDEEKRALEAEILRRKGGQSLLENKRKYEEDKMKKDVERIRKEKEDDRIAKEKIRQKIEQDKAERRAAAEKRAGNAAPVAEAPAPQAPAPTEKKSYSEALVQIRLTDGTTLKSTFLPTDTIATVHAFVAKTLKTPFQLANTYPRKIYSGAEMQTTLAAAGLVPNGTLAVTK